LTLRSHIAREPVQAAHPIYNTEHRETDTVPAPGGQTIVEFRIASDAYGHGLGRQFKAAEPAGNSVDYRKERLS
jgi:hypothetical protein